MKSVFGPGIGCGVIPPSSRLQCIPAPWPARGVTQPTFLGRSVKGYHSERGQELCEMGVRSWNSAWDCAAYIQSATHPTAMA